MNYLQIDPTHVHPGAQVLGFEGEHTLPQVEVAKAVFGTDSEATIGKATIAATPIFFKTSRLLMPCDGILLSKRFSRFNWSSASQMKSSFIFVSNFFSTSALKSEIELFPSQCCHIKAAVSVK